MVVVVKVVVVVVVRSVGGCVVWFFSLAFKVGTKFQARSLK
jgi:hypothetical protein